MLQRLQIQNYALIDHLDISFNRGFSVITGETGAGKSILLGAIGLLLGQRADSKNIKDGAQRCVIEAQFCLDGYRLEDFFEEHELDFDGSECIIRREITSTGKSRAFINDTPASVAQLRELGDKLIDIHSQHQNLLLAKENFQLQVLDIVGKNSEILAKYKQQYQTYRSIQKELEELEEQKSANLQEQEFLQFQYNQLEEAALSTGEDEELEEELQRLEHAEEIKSTLFGVSNTLEGEGQNVLDTLADARKQLTSISSVLPIAEKLAERIESCRIELKDVSSDITAEAEDTEYDSERLSFVNDRLSLIYQLEKKHHVENVAALLELKEEIERKLDFVSNIDENIDALRSKLTNAEKELSITSKALTDKRSKASADIEKELTQRLAQLGMPNVQFRVEMLPTKDYEGNGCDHASFLFAANKGGTLQPISQVASGGEIARVMLSLKAMISTSVQLPTIIFDEIDTGVSGQMAERMAQIMQEMGTTGGRQVISITHLPQIAALGTSHYRVFKEEDADTTTSHIELLDTEQRIKEIAHMLSGSTITPAAMDNAKALLNM